MQQSTICSLISRQRYIITPTNRIFSETRLPPKSIISPPASENSKFGKIAFCSIIDKSSAVAEMGDCGHNRHGPKRGGAAVHLSRGELGPRLTQCGLGRGLLPYQVSSSSIQPFGHNRHGTKTGGCAPFRGRERRHHLTTSPGPRFTSIRSGILIHPAVWPQ